MCRNVVHLLGKAQRIESLDYEIYENMVYKAVSSLHIIILILLRQAQQQSRTDRERMIYMAMRWVFALIIAFFTALAAFLINMVRCLNVRHFLLIQWFCSVLRILLALSSRLPSF